ncbi:putative phosphatidylserine decarboxylase [Ascobolus immersus RN42]|uniref:phosphatidylserine decarboxylase n=1 Tax=Ascobolus immersus RN42 TaxID=1160509 RepID=A0A3N4IJD1_ASCIM|nr:putative phosphatidylserine decarboxylase [Ascobolus immersus RN42]
MGLIDLLHRAADYALSYCKLIQNREVGWQTVDRKTGKLMREKQPLLKKLKLLILFNPLLEWIDLTRAMRVYLHDQAIKGGKEEQSTKSKSQIKEFVKFYGIDMELFEPSDINAYPNFQDFFIRKHKAGTRPIYQQENGSIATCVADCRMVAYETVSLAQKIWIKGKNFSLANLIQDEEKAKKWADGSVASFRLSPQDYHRFHSPVRGRVKWWKSLPGDYYLVDPLCIRSDIDVLCMNARSIVCLETEEFGEVLFTAIGAAQVGTVKFSEKITKMEGAWFEKGEEIGFFEFGGSSIVVAFEPGRIQFDDDLVQLSKQALEVDVEVGMSLGKATKA